MHIYILFPLLKIATFCHLRDISKSFWLSIIKSCLYVPAWLKQTLSFRVKALDFVLDLQFLSSFSVAREIRACSWFRAILARLIGPMIIEKIIGKFILISKFRLYSFWTFY